MTDTNVIERTDSNIEREEGHIAEAFARLSRHRLNPAFRSLEFDRIRNIAASESGARSVHMGDMRKRWFSCKRIPVAVKVMNIFERSTKADRLRIAMDVLQEVSVWTKLNHPNILPFVGFCIKGDYTRFWLVSDYLSRGNLREYINSDPKPSVEERWNLAIDTANGLQYLHTLSPPIYHGDLKAANILMSNENRALLCDFGSAGTVDSPYSALVTTEFTLAATMRYQSPEQCMGEHRTLKSDMWSWGCLALEIILGQRPYHGHSDMSITKCLIIDKVPPANVAALDCPQPVRGLLTGCWNWRPDLRLSVGDCLGILVAGPPPDTRGDGDSSQASPPSGSRTPSITPSPPSRPSPPLPSDEPQEDLPESRLIKASDLDFGTYDTVIGQGGFSIVRLARLWTGSATGIDVAVKQCNLRGERDRDELLRGFDREMSIWQSLSHPNILPLLGHCFVPNDDIAWFVSPYMVNGNVKDYLVRVPLPLERRLCLVHDMAKGLEYLHSRVPPVVHGDMKAANILVSNNGVAVITDFGTSKFYADDQTEPAEGLVGSFRWMAPELVIDNIPRKNMATDVWAWACATSEVITGRIPYWDCQHDGAFVQAMFNRRSPADVNTIEAPIALRNLLSRCWSFEPDQRPNMTECCRTLQDIMSEMGVSERVESQGAGPSDLGIPLEGPSAPAQSSSQSPLSGRTTTRTKGRRFSLGTR